MEVFIFINIYIRILGIGFIPSLWYQTFNGFLVAQGITKPQMCLSLFAMLLNGILNYAFLYGFVDLPSTAIFVQSGFCCYVAYIRCLGSLACPLQCEKWSNLDTRRRTRIVPWMAPMDGPNRTTARPGRPDTCSSSGYPSLSSSPSTWPDSTVGTRSLLQTEY